MPTLFFSVIMPVYNAENYLRNAVASVLAQTYPHFELILVDDCAKDNSPAICDELAKQDARIQVIHLEQNGGVSNARNVGIRQATGDYVYFIDSDDTIDSSLLKDVAFSLEEHPSQVLLFGLVEEYYNTKERFPISYPEKILDKQEAVRKEIIYIENATLFGYVWNKFYDLAYLKKTNALFQPKTLNEDFYFNADYFLNISSLTILPGTYYHYQKQNEHSLTSVYIADYFDLHEDRIQVMKDLHRHWNIYTDEVRMILGNIYCRYIFSALQRNHAKQANMTYKERKQWLKNLYKTDLFNDVIPAASPESRLVRLMSALLQGYHLYPTLLSSAFIYFVKTRMPLLFVKIKQNR